jgi:hypothetical protein
MMRREYIERAEVIVAISRVEIIGNPGNWSHKATKQFTTSSRPAGGLAARPGT